MKPKDYPIHECAEACEKIIAKGGTIYQKWTCEKCGDRVTASNPNTFTLQGHHEGKMVNGVFVKCDHTTDLDKAGCNYMVIFGEPLK